MSQAEAIRSTWTPCRVTQVRPESATAGRPPQEFVGGPSPWSLLLARSYARHLCRLHGAHSAELTRHSRQPVSPEMMFQEPARAIHMKSWSIERTPYPLPQNG